MINRMLLIACLLLFSFARGILSQPSSGVIILEMTALDDASQKDAPILTRELAAAIGRTGNYPVAVKTSAELMSLFEAQGETMPTFWDELAVKKIGSWLGSDYVVSGTLSKSDGKRFDIDLQLFDINREATVSTAHIAVLDYKHRLLMNRLAKLLFWARLTIACNLSSYEATLNDAILQEDSKDPDYRVWLVEPGEKYILKVWTKEPNYTTSPQEFIFNIAENRTAVAKLKYRMGILEVRSNPRANVYINGEKIGKTTLKQKLQDGQYTLALKAGRHHGYTKSVTISPEDTTRVQATLAFNKASYRRNGIITLTTAILLAGGGFYTSREADKAYDRYLETMNVSEMQDYRDKANTYDSIRNICYGAAGAFALWSLFEWGGLMWVHPLSEMTSQTIEKSHLGFSLTKKGITLSYQFN